MFVAVQIFDCEICILIVFGISTLTNRFPKSTEIAGQAGTQSYVIGLQDLYNMLLMRIIAQHLNCIFRSRVPKPYFPARGPFKTGRGLFESIGGACFVSNLHVEKVKNNVQSMRYKDIRNVNIWGGSFCQPFGETYFRTMHPKLYVL